jgi:hypothetical protein
MLELGFLVGGATILAFVILYPIFRQPVPPRWTQNGLIAEVVTVALVAGFACGIFLIVAGLIKVAQTGISLLHIGLLAVVLVVLAMAWRRLRSHRVPGQGTGKLPTA